MTSVVTEAINEAPLPAALTPDKKREAIDILQQALEIVKRIPEQASCSDCLNFESKNAFCHHWKATVPAEAQSVGCAQFGPDIPF